MNDPIFTTKIIDTYSNCNNKDNCNFSMNEIISIPWDSMYVVGGYNNDGLTNREAISAFINANYKGKRHENDILSRSIIFTKEGKMIYEVYSSERHLNHENYTFRISFLKNKSFKKGISNKNANFRIEKYEDRYILILK